jgi:hypothetical protein
MKHFISILILCTLLLSACSQSASPASATLSTTLPSSTPRPGIETPKDEETQTGMEFLVVSQLSPLPGAVFNDPVVSLTWQVVPNAVSYRLRVAKDSSFTENRMEFNLNAPPRLTNPLPVGRYYWQVQAVGGDGSILSISSINTFQVQSAEASYPADDMIRLNVPYLHQGKDSGMLLLESTRQDGPHAWNRPHEAYDPLDPADSANGAFACIAMLNHFAGGDLTQDRLGYEIFNGRQSGPETDLPYGTQPDPEEVALLLQFALGSGPTAWPEVDTSGVQTDFIEWTARQIDHGSPVLAYVNGLYVLISGYQQNSESTEWWILDPASGSYRLIDHGLEWQWAYAVEFPAAPRFLEDSLKIDSDKDGVLDFDEKERFHTDPLNPDSDFDGISDGDEIRASVFDPQYGLAAATDADSSQSSRDSDQDGLPMELDIDSDNGGCLDGFEDKNLDGRFRPEYGETSNFDPVDDHCYALQMTWQIDDELGITSVDWKGSFNVDSKNRINGRGVAVLSHTGTCIDSTLGVPFFIEGIVTDTLLIEIDLSENFEVGKYNADDLADGCSIADAIDENWTVSNNIYSGLPSVMDVSVEAMNNASPVTITPPPNASRPASIQLTVYLVE